MSYRTHNIRQSQNIDYPVDRQPSTVSSSASSGYSNSSGRFDFSRTGTMSSASSAGGYGSIGHRRGKSEVPRIPPSMPGSDPYSARPKPENIYNMARQSLRPLAQAPSSAPSTPPKHQLRHERGQSVDIGRLSLCDTKQTPERPLPSPPRPSAIRPQSMVLTRTDSIKNGGTALSPGHTAHHVHANPLASPDFESLGKSSTDQLRTLSKLAQAGSTDSFSITSPAQEVAGLRGRRRLQKADKPDPARSGQRSGGYCWEGRNWMDKQRQFLQAYEYLCHIGEAKEWIEDIIHRPIPPIVELEQALRDGVTLAEVVEALNPERRYRIFRHPRLQYRHSDNIAIFFRYLDEVELPDLFRFELIDLYEKKNIPKVIYCIHALSWILFRKGIVDFRIGNLVGQLEFEHHELEAMQKGLDKLGANMPSFGNMGADFGVEEPPPEPEETEEERIARELAENERSIVSLQTRARGSLARMRLGGLMQGLWDSEDWLVDLQSRLRGDFIRQVVDYRLQMRRFAVNLQSTARGFLARRRRSQKQRFWKKREGDVLKLQSLIRAKKSRNDVRDTRAALRTVAGPIRDIQSVFRGALARERVYSQLDETSRAEAPTRELQAAIRAMLLRKKVSEDQKLLRKQTRSVTSLQGAARALLVRNNVYEDQQLVNEKAHIIRGFQAATRGALLRIKITKDQELLREQTQAITRLQSAARGMLVRGKTVDDQDVLHEQAEAITDLQSAIRGMLTRHEVAQQMEHLESFTPEWEALQAAVRGKLVRAKASGLKAELRQLSPFIGLFQSCARAGAVRREVAVTLDAFDEEEPEVVNLQSLIRGMLERQRVAAELGALEEETPEIIDLQSRIRGFVYLKQHSAFLDALQANENEIIDLQALARAMLLRAEVGDVLTHLEEEEESIAAAQAVAKAFVVREKFAEKKRHFNENMSKVIKIQSFVRGKLQGEAYKSLTHGRDPPVNAVKNFVHLLNDSDFDFNEEVEFERLRKTVVQQVRQNEMLEQYIDQLDIKIALLVKNKITLDEVVRHQSNFGGHTGTLIANSTMASANQFDLKALNKSSRKKLECYQQLFFTLQTQPQYLARLCKRIREQGTAEKESKRMEHLLMGLFGYAQKRREEYYLLKLISRSIREEIEESKSLSEYLRGNYFWSKLLASYSRSPRDRKYLRDLLGPLIRDNIIEDPALDLESDPMQIYRSAINNEELRTGRPSRRPLDIPREFAIKDPETRELFIDHLRDLREICDQFLLALEDLLARMPYGLRFICKQMFETLCHQFKRESHHHLLQLVGNWLWRFYLQPAVTAPENVGVVDKQLSPLQKRNLSEVAKVLGQIASGRPFGGDNVYLQPLNAFIGESMERLGHIMGQLIAVPDAESTFDIDEFNDLYARNKPTLYIKMSDIFAIHSLVASELSYICPNRDDMLREIIQDLGSAKNNENEMTGAGSTDIQMFLTPKLHELDDPDAVAKTLFMETKRCILYIIRVQSGTNLLEILVKPINPEDEHKWQTLLHEDFASGTSTRGAYSDANMVDVTRMSYFDLKRTALENIMRLEHLGRISKTNYYQDVLNAIALDIRTKSRRRVQRQRELECVRLTLGNLHQKAKYLEQQRKSYDDYIEQAMMTLQNKKGKKRFLLPFTKQYNHQRELERSGRVPKFGSFKYSARALNEKGVVVSWTGIAERDWGQVNLTISCDQVGIFNIEGSRGHIQIPGASAMVSIEDLLQAQFETHQFINLFEGNLRLNVNLLLHLLYKKFYRTQ